MDIIKAVFTDLDGTLLRADKTVSQRTMEAIRRFQAQGGIWAVASARPERAITMYPEFREADALITLNGARNRIGNRVISNGISIGRAKRFLSELFRNTELLIILETSAGIFANTEIPEWHTPRCPDLAGLLQTCDIYKVLLAGRDHRLLSVTEPREDLMESSRIADLIREAVTEHKLSDSVYYTVAEGWLYQIMSRSAAKWNGVKMVLAEEGIPPERAMYFGDDNDDAESIRCAGVGVAMGNAIDAVKEAADLITASNEEDGVARILEMLENQKS